MGQPYTSIAVIALCLVALWFLSPLFRRIVFRAVVGQPNLRIEELPDIFNGHESFHIERNPRKKMPGADKSIQASNSKVSIIYHTTKHAEGVTETVDIAYPGKFGMIFTLVNDRMTCLERIGGTTRNNPELAGEEENALTRFMIALRDCFKQA